MVVFSVDKGFNELLGRDFSSGHTYLLRRDGQGPWREVKSWLQPAVK